MSDPISTPVRAVSELTPDHILTAVTKTQNSGFSIKFNENIQLEFVLVRLDEGWGDNYPGAGGLAELLYFGRFLQKRSVRRVAAANDNTCLAKAVILGTAHRDLQDARAKHPKGSEEVKTAEKRYKLLGNNLGLNRPLTTAVNQLYKNAGVPLGKIGDIADLEKFDQVLGICSKVISIEDGLKFVPKKYAGKKYVYLCYSRAPGQTVGHYDLVTNVRAFFSKRFYCEECDVSYSNLADHQCDCGADLCVACFDKKCFKNFVSFQSCESCKLQTWSEECRKRHKLLQCSRKWRCERCRTRLFRTKILDDQTGSFRLQSDLEMDQSHRCHYYFCYECKNEVPDDHRCYIKKKSYAPHIQKYLFFDFETDQSSGEHVVNYIHFKYFEESETVRMPPHDHAEWKGEWVDVEMKGDGCLNDFLKLLTTDKKFAGYTCIAHNLRGFDGIFILRTLLENGVKPGIIVKGQKIMMMRVGKKLRFIDSFNFLPMGLAKLPAAFGLKCGSKGYFPHFFNRPENWDYIGPIPAVEYYGMDQMSCAEKAKFLTWYKDQDGKVFNFQEELAYYCRQDVEILAASCLAFRKLMCQETGCDPFAYVSLASVCSAVFMTKFMKPNTIARVPPSGYANAKFSDEALEWLEYVRRNLKVKDLRHAANGGEVRIGNYRADGFDKTSNTIYEYYGCFHHGCPKCFPEANTRNPDTRKRLKKVYMETLERESVFRSMGFQVKSVWACEWKRLKTEDPEAQLAIKELDIPSPLNPRDAFFGGRTETFKLFSTEAPISYVDYVSLYPFTQMKRPYPIGHPEIILDNFRPLEEYFGIIKCKILPPDRLHIPVLPIHSGRTRKLIFALCRTCAECAQTEPCQHDETERAMVGTWFSEELKLAVRKGYKILKIYSVWHFEEKSKGLFAGYVRTFYKKKLLSSKPPYQSEEEMANYIKQVEAKEGIKILDIKSFEENPGMRQLTKLMLNNLWGRFGMQENMSKSTFVGSFQELAKLLQNEDIEVQGLRVISEKQVQVIHRSKDLDHLATAKDTNIFIAVATTAWARIHLYEALDKVHDRVLYCDTDSVIYARGETNLETGHFLGEMTDELDSGDEITEFVSPAAKNYAFKTRNGSCVVKVKGFTMNCVNAPVFTFENMKRVVLGCVSFAAESERMEILPMKRRKLDVMKLRDEFALDHRESKGASALAGGRGISVYNPVRIFRTRDWKVIQKPEQKLYSFHFDKRIVLNDMSTLPFGWK